MRLPGSDIPLRSSFLAGVGWTGLSQYINYILQLLVVTILARLLGPPAFGIIAMVLVYTGFASIFVTGGFGTALIQDREADDAAFSTLFWFSCALGLALLAITVVIADGIERIFSTEDLAVVIRWISPVLLFSAAGSIPAARLRRLLRFRTLAASSVLSAAIAGVTAVIAALNGAGVRALVLQVVVGAVAQTCFLLAAGGWRPTFTFKYDVVKRTLRFSSHVVGFSSINYWARAGDDFLIGRYLGATQLGLYSLAYKLMFIPQQAISNVIGPVLHPALASIQDDSARSSKVYSAVLSHVTRISFITGTFMAFMAGELILTLWGETWGESIAVLQWLAIVSIIQVPISTCGPALLGKGESGLFFRLGIFGSLIILSSFILSVRFGIVAVAQGYLAANLIAAPVVLGVTARLYALRWSKLAAIFAAGILPALIVAAICIRAESNHGIRASSVQAVGGSGPDGDFQRAVPATKRPTFLFAR